jgi:hypothetical protein
MEEYSKNPAVQYSLFEKSIGTLPLFYFEYSDQTVRSLIADKFLEIIQHIKDRVHRSGTKEISDLFIASTESAVDWLKPEYLNAFPMQAKYIDAFKNLSLEAYLIRLRMQLNTLLRALHP